MAKKSGVPLGQECVPQVERYTGSDVIGMERTTARPMHWETGADPRVRVPGDHHFPDEFIYWAEIKGKKVMR